MLIAVYPYLTGLVAGAFTVSSLYHVFGMERFKPVAQFALLTALCFMLFVPMPLLLHLGHPERAFNAVLTPHWTSAMAAFGYFAGFYIILLILEIWFVFRPYFVRQAQLRTGLAGTLCRVLSLGSYDLSDKAMSYDHKWMFALAVIGIPGAHGLHGYVGFIFGSLEVREWWSSDLMPVVFLFSAVISGVALLIVLYVLSCRLRKVAVDLACLKGLAYVLWGFMMFTLVLEGLEFSNIVYKGREGIEMIMEYVMGPLVVPFFVVQLGIGAVTPIALDLVPDLARHHRQGADRGSHRERGVGAAVGVDDALERGHRRPGNLEDGKGPAELSHAHFPQGRFAGCRRIGRRTAGFAGSAGPAASALGR